MILLLGSHFCHLILKMSFLKITTKLLFYDMLNADSQSRSRINYLFVKIV